MSIKKKKSMCKKKVIFFSGLGCLMFIFCSLLMIKIILDDNLLDSVTGYIIGGIGTIVGIVMTGRVADDVQMGINYKPGLDKNEE
jgi:hypothetical protein